MLARTRRAIVACIEAVDSALDHIPSWEADDDGQRRWFRHGHWGCRLRLAHLSWHLDQRWSTGHWRPPTDADFLD